MVSSHKLQQRSYIVVPLAKVSPTMTGGRITAWQKDVGAYVDCYDLLYEFDAQGVTDDDASSSVKMEVECCDEGFLAVVFDPLPAEPTLTCRPMLAPDTPVALLCETEDEMRTVQAQFAASSAVRPATDAQVMTWHAYLRDPRPSDPNSCCS
ncbi:hypothetical protein SPRG_08861 [Saprolegnia parasitica CBS 223.65]|uniref:Uncharacterized protein n=1 Tax=Saprolegnia parasitica (strain CBS 223.65) TaxID=695850 RepID=A0A067C9R5_SAPPC|nr:hypothetical protein SPRG_08861 [Saprolegnia parasitica CBS 223.65]KDO25920.1 hypothetical protein SPRG_08861 [Saprolegnia parasitica CBS 223.65]|eukprot:XP_012203480.1 hypothetical protein SPRG_08861 [Saprolegnia parasitica CBS 223.65]